MKTNILSNLKGQECTIGIVKEENFRPLNEVDEVLAQVTITPLLTLNSISALAVVKINNGLSQLRSM